MVGTNLRVFGKVNKTNFSLVTPLNHAFLCLNLCITGFNPLSANHTKWSNTLKQFVGNLPKNCLSVFDHLVGLALKGLRQEIRVNLK